MDDSTPPILADKRIRLALLALAGLFVVMSAVWLFNFLTSGQLVITTNDPRNSITISSISGGSSTTVKQGAGGLSVRLRPGQYIALAQNRVFETSRIVQIKSRQKSSYELDVRLAGTVEPVLPTGAYDVVSDGSSLLFVDAASGGLYQVSDGRAPSLISTTPFRSMKWSGVSSGVGQGRDGRLYVYQNGGVSPLTVPFAYADGVNVDYAITGSGSVYVSFGQDVYANRGGGFQKVLTTDSKSPVLVAGKNHLAVVDGQGTVEGQKGSPDKSSVTVLDGSGRRVTKNLGASLLAWSADDKYIAVSSELGNQIYTANLNSVTSYPGPSVSSLVWLDGNTLLYGLSGSLWSFSVSADQASVIASTPLQGAVSDIYPGIDGNYVYMTVAKSASNNYELDRVGLHGQSVPDYVLQMSTYFPKALDDCSVTYVNFTRPVLLLQADSASQSICLSEANGELHQDGLDSSKFSFVNVPVPATGSWPY